MPDHDTYQGGQFSTLFSPIPWTFFHAVLHTLLVVRREGGVFEDDETVQVNYRIQGNRYIVDTVFDSAILIAGVGGNQDAVAIKRVKK